MITGLMLTRVFLTLQLLQFHVEKAPSSFGNMDQIWFCKTRKLWISWFITAWMRFLLDLFRSPFHFCPSNKMAMSNHPYHHIKQNGYVKLWEPTSTKNRLAVGSCGVAMLWLAPAKTTCLTGLLWAGEIRKTGWFDSPFVFERFGVTIWNSQFYWGLNWHVTHTYPWIREHDLVVSDSTNVNRRQPTAQVETASSSHVELWTSPPSQVARASTPCSRKTSEWLRRGLSFSPHPGELLKNDFLCQL